MLVLLIIFLITVPAIIQKVPVVLPEGWCWSRPRPSRRTSRCRFAFAADGSCEVFWGMTKVNSTQLIQPCGQQAEVRDPQAAGSGLPIELPEAHIRGDINTPYRCIGGAIFTMQRAGFARVGFISEPPAGYITRLLLALTCVA